MKYRFSVQAQRDVEAISSYVAESARRAAVRLVARLKARLELLGTQPRTGRARADLRPGLRQIVFGSYLAFYQIDEGEMVILRVLHGKRDISSDDFT